MDNKQLTIIMVTIIICASIIGVCIYFGLSKQNEYHSIDNATNNTTDTNLTMNNTTDTLEDSHSVSSSDSSSSSSNSKSSSNQYSSSEDDGAFYSEQSGKMVYTGDVELGDDDNYWVHKGYNQWEKL